MKTIHFAHLVILFIYGTYILDVGNKFPISTDISQTVMEKCNLCVVIYSKSPYGEPPNGSSHLTASHAFIHKFLQSWDFWTVHGDLSRIN